MINFSSENTVMWTLQSLTGIQGVNEITTLNVWVALPSLNNLHQLEENTG